VSLNPAQTRCDKVLDTTLGAKVCQKITAGQWFSLGTPVSIQQKN